MYHYYLWFFIYTLNTESNVIIFVNSHLKVSERGEIQPIQIRNFGSYFAALLVLKKTN